MRIYKDDKKEEIFTIICNKCKKEIRVDRNIIKEGVFQAEHLFGYFSEKDGETHSFDLCEACYDEWIDGFAIPPEISEVTELI